jgi:hypothetical protein
MTTGLAAATANSILGVLRNAAYAAIATPFVELHIADPGAAGTTSVSAGSTTRNAVTWNAPSGGSMTVNTLTAWTNGGASESISHVAIFTASTAGTFVQSGALTVAQAWVSTNTLTLTTFTLSYTPIAA